MAAGLVLSALMRVDDTDPRIKFSAGWSSGGVNAEYNATAHGTTVQGASVVFSFSGTHVEVYGTIYQLNGSEPAPISSYTLDDSSSATFVPTRQTHPQYQQLFYSSPVVDDGEHVLAITSTIEDSHFWLDYFAYSPSASASSTPIVETGGITSHDDTSTSSQSPPSQPGSNRNDALLGALIGALVALVLLLCAVAFVYHRTRRRQDLKATAFVVDPPPIPRPRTRQTRRRPELSLDDRLAASEAGPLPPMHNVFGHDEGDRVRASVVPSTPSSHQYLSPNSRPALYCQNDVDGAIKKEKT